MIILLENNYKYNYNLIRPLVDLKLTNMFAWKINGCLSSKPDNNGNFRTPQEI
jgi:hypothetical protein